MDDQHYFNWAFDEMLAGKCVEDYQGRKYKIVDGSIYALDAGVSWEMMGHIVCKTLLSTGWKSCTDPTST